MAINKLTKKFMGAMMAVSVAFVPVSAAAADGQPQYADITKKETEYVQYAGIAASGKNRIALKVNGGSDAMLNAMWEAAKEIEKETDRDVWLLHSVDVNPEDNNIDIEIYVGGAFTGTLSVESNHGRLLNEKLAAVVRDGIEKTSR